MENARDVRNREYITLPTLCAFTLSGCERREGNDHDGFFPSSPIVFGHSVVIGQMWKRLLIDSLVTDGPNHFLAMMTTTDVEVVLARNEIHPKEIEWSYFFKNLESL